MNLYTEQNKEGEPPLSPASLFDVCDWIIDSYPKDIFDGSSRDEASISIVKIKNECNKILRLRK